MEVLESLLEKLFHVGADSININMCNNGDVNSCYIAEYRGDKYFIKVQNSKGLPTLYENQIEREVAGTILCEKQGIPCPHIIDYNLDEKYIVTEFMEYELLGNIWNNLGPQEQKHVKRQALNLLKSMGLIKSEFYGALYNNGRIKQYKNWIDAYKDIVRIALEDCYKYKSLTQPEAIFITDRVEKNCSELYVNRQEKAVFAHMDFHWNNIFIDKNTLRIQGIFDFGSSLYVPEYMAYFRMNGGFLYGTEYFYDQDVPCPIDIGCAEYECADILNTLDYFTFLSYKGKDYTYEKEKLMCYKV